MILPDSSGPRTLPPYVLRTWAKNARNRAALGPDGDRERRLADKYDRMAYAREWLWNQYVAGCLELDE